MEMNAVQTNTKPTAKEQGYSVRETELIQELIKARLEHKAELEHESLEGYELPPRTQFSMLKNLPLRSNTGISNSTWPAFTCLRVSSTFSPL